LAGIDNCFEKYTYTCSRCSGDVSRHFTELDGVTAAQTLITSFGDGKTEDHYRAFYRCSRCDASVEVTSA